MDLIWTPWILRNNSPADFRLQSYDLVDQVWWMRCNFSNATAGKTIKSAVNINDIHLSLCLYNRILLNRLPWWLSGKNPPAVQETQVWSLGQEDSLEKEMATPSSILVWEIPWDRGAWRVSVHGVTKELATTRQLNNNNLLNTYLSDNMEITGNKSEVETTVSTLRRSQRSKGKQTYHKPLEKWWDGQ